MSSPQKQGYHRAWRQTRVKNNICIACGIKFDKKLEKKSCPECLKKARLYRKTYCRNNKAKVADSKHRSWAKTKNTVFGNYGGYICACCGETIRIFLTIDHINNDGAEHRRTIGGIGRFYRWLLKNGCPKGFQVMCRNCNWAKYANKGLCPHKDMTNAMPKKV